MTFTVSKEFKSAFDFCMNYFGTVNDKEELEFEKSRVRDNYERAQRCYFDIAKGLGHDTRLVKEAA